MARNESDREDILEEATALVRRAEIVVAEEADPVVAGVRETGALSLYFGADPVYHFDDRNRLRRAFVHGKLFRTQGTALAELTRVRTDEATELHRRDIDGPEMDRFLAEMKSHIAKLHSALDEKRATVGRRIPANGTFVEELMGTLSEILLHEATLAPSIVRGR